MSIGENIKRVRERHDLTQEEFGKIADVSPMAVSQWENDRAVPRMGAIQRISDYFGIQKSEIIDGEQMLPFGTILPGRSKSAFAQLLGRVHAGDAQKPEVLDGMIELPSSVLERHPHAFFLQVEGDCMDRVYTEYCYVLIDPDREPQDGSIAAVRIDGSEIVMRRLRKGANTLILSPESTSSAHKDIIVAADSDHIVENVGTVVWFQAKKELE
jgi:repressor LexA